MENETLNELFDKGISEDKLFVITYIAEYLTTMYDFTLYNGRLYAKFDKKYISNEKDIIQRLNDDVKLTKRQFKELLYQLDYYMSRMHNFQYL